MRVSTGSLSVGEEPGEQKCTPQAGSFARVCQAQRESRWRVLGERLRTRAVSVGDETLEAGLPSTLAGGSIP